MRKCEVVPGNIGLSRRGSSGRKGDMSLPGYRIESHTFRLWGLFTKGGSILRYKCKLQGRFT